MQMTTKHARHTRCKTNKYTDHHIQDELIKLLAHSHLCRIAVDIKAAGYFALEADEVTDASNKEQVASCVFKVG